MVSDQVLLALIGTVTVLSAAAVSVLVPLLNNRQTRAMQAAKDEAAAKEKLAEAEAHRREKQEDWARQDQVAAVAREAAAKVELVVATAAADSKKLLARQDVLAAKAEEAGGAAAAAAAEAAKLLVASNEEQKKAATVVASQLAVIDAQGKAIHTLVNSGYTEVMKSELRGLRRELALLMQLAEMNSKAGNSAIATDAAIALATGQIAELEIKIKALEDAAVKVAADAAGGIFSSVEATAMEPAPAPA